MDGLCSGASKGGGVGLVVMASGNLTYWVFTGWHSVNRRWLLASIVSTGWRMTADTL